MIKVILVSDNEYIGKMEKAMKEFLSDRISVKSFKMKDDVYSYVKSNKNAADIIIADESFEFDRSIIPERWATAYFSESIKTYMLNGEMTLFIYQNINEIYNSVLNIIDNHMFRLAEENDREVNDGRFRNIAFFSCTGGAGGSVFAKAFAVNRAAKNKKVLYIPLEVCTGANTVFKGSEESLSLSDIFHDISNNCDKKTLKKTVSRAINYDETYKVHFIPAFYTINDAFNVTEQQFNAFISLIAEEEFQIVIFDADFSLPAILNPVIKRTDSIVLVSNATEHSNLSTDRIYNYISSFGDDITDRINIIYNRFVNGTSRIYTKNRLNILGGIGKLSKSSRKFVMENVSGLDIFKNIQ